jgi:protein-disulfide isomerase
MSRNRTLERRKEREQQRRRQRLTVGIISVVVAAILLALILILVNQPAEAPIPEDAVARYVDIPQSESIEGFPKLGSSDAPVKVVEYASFDCPHCREFHETVFPTLIERVRAGEVEFTYVPLYNTGAIANGEGAARAAICAAKQGQFWPLHDALFDWQGAYANTAFSDNRFRTGIANLGIDSGLWAQCFNSAETTQILNAAVSAGQLQNISGTPTIVINGIAVGQVDLNTVNAAIDQALAVSGQPPAPITESTSEASDEATAEATTEAAEATAEATTSP